MIRSHGVLVLFNTGINAIDLSQIDTSLLDVVTLRNVRIETLKLPERQVEAEITIGNCSLGTLVGDDRTYHSHLTLSGCDIRRCLFRAATFSDQVQILGCTISEEAEFGASVFKDILLFSQPDREIRGDRDPDWDADLSSATKTTQFDCTANFSGTTYHEFARFAGCSFNLGAHFDDIVANTTLSFSNTRFRHFGNFRLSDFYRTIDFTESIFGYATFEECYFHDSANFSNAVFHGHELSRLLINRREFENHMASEGLPEWSAETTVARSKNLHLLNSPVGTNWDLNMNEVTVDGALLLKPVSYSSSICLQHAEFEDLQVQAMTVGSGVIGLDESTVRRGEIRFIEDGNPSIAVERTILGDIRLFGLEGVNPVENLYFGNTEFDGFGFDSHRMFFEDIDWDLMGTAREKMYTGRESEQQFVNARVAARQAGDDTAAARFFIKEKRNRRRRHWNEASIGGVINLTANVSNALSNLCLDLLCKYGESSRRLLSVAMLTILGYAELYSLINTPLNYGLDPTIEQSVTVPALGLSLNAPLAELLAYLLFSAEVFTTFVLSSPTVSDPAVRAVAASEGLVGALFVALLVFTLTKSLHR
jgi:uncharacterized protein YjbI with pentapeptide repeats